MNVLHHKGIPETVVDVNCTLPRTLGIVDAIDCMEGDGRILGSRKPMGLLLGANRPALDATAARIMGLEPTQISYLQVAEGRLGPQGERLIDQRGEPWRDAARPFQLLAKEHLQRLRSDAVGPLLTLRPCVEARAHENGPFTEGAVIRDS